jgi:hypothetical protein
MFPFGEFLMDTKTAYHFWDFRFRKYQNSVDSNDLK